MTLAFYLGLVDYSRAWEWQQALVRARRQGHIPDIVLLLEHPHVYTLGASGRKENILIPRDRLEAQGIPVLFTDRGGDITYHGPGQVVGYLIFHLQKGDVHQFVRQIEEAIILALDRFSVTAGRLPGYPGVWVGEEKVCAIGLRLSGGVSSHGFALNVCPQLDYFSYIHPCGLRDRAVTSLSRLLGKEVTVAEVIPSLVKGLETAFHRPIWLQPLSQLWELCHELAPLAEKASR